MAIPRFLRTEHGFNGRFYCALQRALEDRRALHDGFVLEMEYQKSARHGLTQRPDIILHVPAEDSGARVNENNLVVWALKRRATAKDAREDFAKFDEMFAKLDYSFGVFVNIDAKDHLAGSYNGKFPKRVQTVAVWLERDVVTNWGNPK